MNQPWIIYPAAFPPFSLACPHDSYKAVSDIKDPDD